MSQLLGGRKGEKPNAAVRLGASAVPREHSPISKYRQLEH